MSCLFFLVAGCGDKPAPQKKQVFSQKIVDKEEGAPEESQEEQTPPLPPEIAKELGIKSSEESSSQLSKKTGGSTVENPSEKSEDLDKTVNNETQMPSIASGYEYNPKGKIDPFMPWRADETSGIGTGQQIKRRTPMTPLEKVDLSQLKLVGVILAPSGNKGLVEDSTGKGFVITKGTYVGVNGGKVTAILEDKVIIEEAVNYGVSGVSVRKRELTLQKPPGEE